MLLEIETDKAQMDVEAQDDGVMAKITVCASDHHKIQSWELTQPLQQPDGSKSVKVGTRIAIIAEPDDDLSTLSLPAEDSAPTSSPKEDMASGVDQSKSSEAQAEATPESSPSDTPKSSSPTKQTYPLYPSVQHLLRENRLDSSEADKIPASGPQGRLLKGDVLAYLGIIPSSYPSTLSERVSKLSHLDLSNVKGSTPKKADVSQPFSAVTPPSSLQPEPPLATEIAVPVSLDAVLTVQKRIEDTLGVHLPLSVFIARATDVANDDLPRPKTAVPTNNELFDQVLGLNKVAITGNASRGHYMPQITALPGSTPPAIAPRAVSRPQQLNVYDILAGKSSNKLFAAGPALRRGGIAAGSRASTNIFSVTASVGEERRARVFLERVKTILEKEPGRLVL